MDPGAAGAPRKASAIAVGATLAPGRAGDLYTVRGYHYGKLGWFHAACTHSGRARTSYRLATVTPDEGVAMDGRRSSCGADLVSGSMPGGVARSGIEHWIVSAGGEPEDVHADAYLTVFSVRDAHGYCDFALRGRLVINLHG